MRANDSILGLLSLFLTAHTGWQGWESLERLGSVGQHPGCIKGETGAQSRKGVACNSVDSGDDKLPPFPHCYVTEKDDLHAFLKHKSETKTL